MNNNHAGQTLTNRLLDEGLLLVRDAAASEGITISSKTALRWCLSGVRGLRLESVKIRGRRMTSRLALRRFIAATQNRAVAGGTDVIDSVAAEAVLVSNGLGRVETP
jgi:hypothetical protein